MTDIENINEELDGSEMLETLIITSVTPRAVGGSWVNGQIAEHKFECLVFEGHAACESYELADSRISKLHLEHATTRQEVACFDRGWDREPTTPAAKMIVDLLAAGLATHIFSK